MTNSIELFARLLFEHPQYFTSVALKRFRIIRRSQWVDKFSSVQNQKSPPPFVFTVKLTNDCNLRCSYCFQWGDTGSHHSLSQISQKQELSWDILSNLLSESKSRSPYFMFWGGEPFMYSKINQLLEYLRNKKIWSSFCTNGLLLGKHLQEIENNRRLAIVVSLDGAGEYTNNHRGKRVYERACNNIKEVLALKKAKPFLGIEFTVLPENVDQMYLFAREMENMGINWIVFNLKWFLTKEQATNYKEVMLEKFSVEATSQFGFIGDYAIDRTVFTAQYKKIVSEKWKIQISWQPSIKDPLLVANYIDSPHLPVTESRTCYKQWIRMDILADASVVACKIYPDYVVGNLNIQTIEQIWNSEKYLAFRNSINSSLLPICAKCEAFGWYNPRKSI